MKYFLGFLFAAVVAVGQEARFETATGTNTISIADFESGELISVLITNSSTVNVGYPHYVKAVKDGYSFVMKSSGSYRNPNGGGSDVSSGVGDIIRGPATYSLLDYSSAQGFTIRITPVSFPPNQTLIVPPGTNSVQVSMESSTNLVNWATATNGVYGSPETVRFFRMKMTNLQP